MEALLNPRNTEVPELLCAFRRVSAYSCYSKCKALLCSTGICYLTQQVQVTFVHCSPGKVDTILRQRTPEVCNLDRCCTVCMSDIVQLTWQHESSQRTVGILLVMVAFVEQKKSNAPPYLVAIINIEAGRNSCG